MTLKTQGVALTHHRYPAGLCWLAMKLPATLQAKDYNAKDDFYADSPVVPTFSGKYKPLFVETSWRDDPAEPIGYKLIRHYAGNYAQRLQEKPLHLRIPGRF